MSDTPRTDAIVASFRTDGNEFAWLEDLKDFARQLERELNDLRAAAITLSEWAEAMKKERDHLRDVLYSPPTT